MSEKIFIFMLMPSIEDFDIIYEAEATIENDQIYNSYVTSPWLKSFFKRHQEVLSRDLIKKLKAIGSIKYTFKKQEK